jgi:hypothetical protein
MKKFLKSLKKEGVFSEVVNCGNIAHHSKHVSSVEPLLLEYMRQVKCLLHSQSMPDCHNWHIWIRV